MTKRNIKVYLKDKTAIIFSMMTQIIILGLYLLFLKQNYVDSMTSMLDGFNIKTEDNLINALVNSWLVSGVIGTSVVTVAMNSLSVMISDKQNKIDYDYNASSVKGSTVVLSYFSGAVINTIVISAILLTAGIAFSCISGSSFPEFTELLKLYGLVTKVYEFGGGLVKEHIGGIYDFLQKKKMEPWVTEDFLKLTWQIKASSWYV